MPTVSRVLLVLVVLAVLAVGVRLSVAGRGGSALLRVGTHEVDALRHEAFALDRTARLAVSATGSFESDTALAAYGWILRRADRAVVWEMTPASVTRGRGSLALDVDTLELLPGEYDAYFATYGDADGPRARGFRLADRPWRSDRRRWAFRLTAADPAAPPALRRIPRDGAAPAGPGLLWGSGPIGRGGYAAYGFEVREPADVRVLAVGDARTVETGDAAWIDDLSTGRRVWTLSPENAAPAGGAPRNVAAERTLRLAPGVYRAVYQGSTEHAAGAWAANPPRDPAAYGLSLFTPDTLRAGAFDPWGGRLPRLVELTNLGHNQDQQVAFTLEDSLRVWVYAVGELSSGGSRWDYADLLRDGEPVWQMSRVESRPAGGAERNRVAEAYLPLGPGRYTLRARTDGSHGPAGWSGDPPHHPERWGVTVFALSPGFRPGDVAVEAVGGAEPPGTAPELPATGKADLPLQLAPLGNDQRVEREFSLEEPTRVRVVAVGEIIRDTRYDYGWIRDASGGVVWEMTRENTEPAGGASKNRRFEGVIALDPGTYTVGFETDGSHAFGDFRGDGPDDPSAWGIALERVDD